MYKGRSRDILPGVFLGEGSHIPYLKERISDLFFFALLVVPVADLITNQITEFN